MTEPTTVADAQRDDPALTPADEPPRELFDMVDAIARKLARTRDVDDGLA